MKKNEWRDNSQLYIYTIRFKHRNIKDWASSNVLFIWCENVMMIYNHNHNHIHMKVVYHWKIHMNYFHIVIRYSQI